MSTRYLVLLGVLFTLSPAGVLAQSGESSEPSGYRAAIDSAIEEMQLGNFVEAREQFAQAHALYPNARTLRGLGVSEFELRHYLLAVDYLTEALSSKERALEGGLRRDTEALLVRAKTYVGELHISVSPREARLLIDGSRSVAKLVGPVRIEVGDHTLEARADGYAPERRQVTVHSGQVQNIDFRLTSLAEPESNQRSETGARVDETPVYKRWWLWTIVGVVVAGAAAGTAIALTRRQEPTEYRGVASANTPDGAGLQPLWRH